MSPKTAPDWRKKPETPTVEDITLPGNDPMPSRIAGKMIAGRVPGPVSEIVGARTRPRDLAH